MPSRSDLSYWQTILRLLTLCIMAINKLKVANWHILSTLIN
jgi:hypothetical protein